MKELNGGKNWEKLCEQVEEWLDLGYLNVLDKDDKTRGFCLPTFIVTREDKTTTKYRFIINGKYEFQGKSLNDMLDPGENLMNNLYDVLLKFRLHKYVFTGDVAQLFLRLF